jgi:hypothetical protein
MNDFTVPDALPILSAGHHDISATGRGCVLDCVSWLSGRPEEGDAPSCVHPVLRSAAIRVNDTMSDDERHLLWALVPRLIGTADVRTDLVARKLLSVRLAVWCARQVLHLVREQDRDVCEKAVVAAEAWCDDPSEENRIAAYAAAVSSSSFSSSSSYAAYVAASYAAYVAASYAANAAAANAAAANAANAAASVASAANAANAAASVASVASFRLLEGLIREHERLTGHQPTPVVESEWAKLTGMLGSVPAGSTP